MAWPLRCVLGLQTHLLLTEMAQNSFAFCFYPTYVPASPNLENPAWIFSNYDVKASWVVCSQLQTHTNWSWTCIHTEPWIQSYRDMSLGFEYYFETVSCCSTLRKRLILELEFRPPASNPNMLVKKFPPKSLSWVRLVTWLWQEGEGSWAAEEQTLGSWG